MSKKLKIGLFGFGCVGSGLYEVLNRSELIDANIEKIVVKDPTKKRSIPESNFNFNKNDILEDPNINVVVELINDAEAAYDIVTTAIKRGKHVVSANKKLIAEHFEELIDLKEKYGVSFLYEASACASIPIIRNLEEYYNNDSLRSVEGICNGTTNYILTRLDRELKDFTEILQDAQDAGFAEIDPTLDIDGFDSKYKLQILIAHAFGLITHPEDILNVGIRHIKQEDIRLAKEKGLKIKLISTARKIDGKVFGFVAPQFIAKDNFGYDVDFEFNATSVEALFSDQQVFKGKGAGSFPTASAVLSDISALQYDYNYEYRKRKTNKLEFTNEIEVKVFISSDRLKNLDRICFLEIEEEFFSGEYAYKVGWIELNSLNHEFYRQNPEIFIAFAGDKAYLKGDRKSNKSTELIYV